MQVKQLVFLNQLSGDPPLRGSPGVLAPYGKRIGWQCIASCCGQECKWSTWLLSSSFLVTHPSVGHLLCLRRMGKVLRGNASLRVEAQSANETFLFSQPVFW